MPLRGRPPDRQHPPWQAEGQVDKQARVPESAHGPAKVWPSVEAKECTLVDPGCYRSRWSDESCCPGSQERRLGRLPRTSPSTVCQLPEARRHGRHLPFKASWLRQHHAASRRSHDDCKLLVGRRVRPDAIATAPSWAPLCPPSHFPQRPGGACRRPLASRAPNFRAGVLGLCGAPFAVPASHSRPIYELRTASMNESTSRVKNSLHRSA